LLYMSEVARL